MRYVIIETACGSVREAESIARTLIRERLAACINLVPGVVSYYLWRGRMVRGRETLLFMKTSASRAQNTMRWIRSMHSYHTPAILSYRIESGDAAYFTWISRVLGSRAGTQLNKKK